MLLGITSTEAEAVVMLPLVVTLTSLPPGRCCDLRLLSRLLPLPSSSQWCSLHCQTMLLLQTGQHSCSRCAATAML